MGVGLEKDFVCGCGRRYFGWIFKVCCFWIQHVGVVDDILVGFLKYVAFGFYL